MRRARCLDPCALAFLVLVWIGTVPPVSQTLAAPAARVQSPMTEARIVKLSKVQTRDQTQVRFHMDGKAAVETIGWRGLQTLEITLAQTTTELVSQEALDWGPIRGIAFAQQGTNLVIAIHLNRKTTYSLSQEEQVLTVRLENPPLEKLVTLNIDNEPLTRVLLMLSRQYGANIIAGSDIQGTVSIQLVDVPLKLALDQILKAEGYRYEEEPGGLLRVVPDNREQVLRENLAKAESQVAYHIVELKHAKPSEMVTTLQELMGSSGGVVGNDRTNTLIVSATKDQWTVLEPVIQSLDKESKTSEPPPAPPLESETDTQAVPSKAAAPVETPPLMAKIIRLSYADPDEVSAMLTPLLSPEGKILVLTNLSKQTTTSSGGGTGEAQLGASVALGGTLMVQDIPRVIDHMLELVQEIDLPVEQIEIQAYIVEGTLTEEENVGIDWRAIDGDNELSATLPFGGQFPALRLRVGNLSANDFAGVLQMISSRSDTQILSQPKIMTVSGRPAIFRSGDQIPYREVVISQNVESVATGFKDTGIILQVTARVKRDNKISLTLRAEVSDVSGFTPEGQPRITGRTASTQVLVSDGDTAVLGGLEMNRTDETVSRVPLLGDIPILGQLFRTKNTRRLKSEVTVFITPRIVREP